MYDFTPENKENHDANWLALADELRALASQHHVSELQTPELVELRCQFAQQTGITIDSAAGNALDWEGSRLESAMKTMGFELAAECCRQGWEIHYYKGETKGHLVIMGFRPTEKITALYQAAISAIEVTANE